MKSVSILFLLASILPSILSSTVNIQEHYQTPATYIVHVSSSEKPSIFRTHHKWYSSTLKSLPHSHLHRPNILYTYSHAATGFSARLTPAQADALSQIPAILSVLPERIHHVHTTHTPTFLGLSDDAGIWPNSDYAEDVVVGVLDTGIWPESKSFSDQGFAPVPSFWKGECETGKDFDASSCNRKLIGATFFCKGYEAAIGRPMNETEESPSRSSLANSAQRTDATAYRQTLLTQSKESGFHGVSVYGKQVLGIGSLKRNWGANSVQGRRRLQVTARSAKTSNNIEVEVDKPLGLVLGQKSGGGVVITKIEGGGNAARCGLKVGDQVLYTSSFFGDELWPADKLGFTKTAIQAKPDSVYFVVSRGGAAVDVKRLPKRPAPPRFGRTLTESQKSRATHICLDCGFIYFLPQPFEDQPDTYGCPQCGAPKKRFAEYDAATGKAIGGGLPPIGVIVGLVAGIAGVGALLTYGLQ